MKTIHRIRKTASDFLSDEEGQAILEYALVLALTVIMVRIFFSRFLSDFRGKVAGFADVLEGELTVGTCSDAAYGRGECFKKLSDWQT